MRGKEITNRVIKERFKDTWRNFIEEHLCGMFKVPKGFPKFPMEPLDLSDRD